MPLLMTDVGIGQTVRGKKGVGSKTDKDQPFHYANLGGVQAIARFVKIVWHVSGGDQATGRVVNPGMIGADKLAGSAGFGQTQLRTAMATNIKERTDRAIKLADDNQRLPRRSVKKKITRFGDTADMPGKEPLAQINPLHVQLEDCRVQIKRLLQAIAGALTGKEISQG
jgi:hypothetical protein